MLENLKKPKKLWPCKIRETIENLPAADQKIMTDAIADPEWQTLTLAKALTANGVPTTEPTLKRHRDNLCSCRFIK